MTEHAVDRMLGPVGRGILTTRELRRALREHPAWRTARQRLRSRALRSGRRRRIAMRSRHVNRIKPRHVFGALVLIGQAPILAPIVAGWLISSLIYAAALGVERARGHGRDRRHRQRWVSREPSRGARARIGGLHARDAVHAIALHEPMRR